LYGCETWFLIWKEEYGLSVFERRVLKKLLGLKSEEVTGDGRQLQSEVFYDLLFSPIITWVIKSRRVRWVGYVAYSGEKINVYRILVGKRRGKRKLGKLRRGW